MHLSLERRIPCSVSYGYTPPIASSLNLSHVRTRYLQTRRRLKRLPYVEQQYTTLVRFSPRPSKTRFETQISWSDHDFVESHLRIMATMTTLCQSQVKDFKAVLTQLPRPNEVVAIDCGIQGDCQITFQCDGKLFEVLLSIEAPGGSIECKYLERLHGSENEEETDQKINELTDLLAELCQP